MANRLITAATIIALLTPLAACGTSGGGGLALKPEHQTRSIADSSGSKFVAPEGMTMRLIDYTVAKEGSATMRQPTPATTV